MKTSIYFISTQYHLLAGLYDLYTKDENGVFVLISNFEDDYQYFIEEQKRLMSVARIVDIIVIPPRNIVMRFLGYKKEYKYLENKYNFTSLNFFSWNLNKLYTNSNYFFSKFKGKYEINFFEDGSNVFLSKKSPVSFSKKLLQKVLNVYTTESAIKFVKKIYVSYPKEYPNYMQNKIIERNISSELVNLPDAAKKRLNHVFLPKSINFNNIGKMTDKSILFTQPLYRDQILTEKEQKRLYDGLIKKYAHMSKVLIVKKHPRDEMRYTLVKNCIVLPRKFPSELLSMYDITFQNSIGVNSSATKSIKAENYLNESLKGSLS